MALNIELDMKVEDGREIAMSVDPIDEVSFGIGEAVVIKDHAILVNRDLPDQHPIDAITDLDTSLESLETEGISNLEIEILLREGD